MQDRADIRSIVQPIMRLAFSLEKIADRKLKKELDLGISQFRMLMVIRRADKLRQRDIAEFWGVAEASVSRQIESLLRHGLVARVTNPKNRRERVLSLTPEGAAAIARATGVMEAELEEMFAAIPPNERKGLADGLRRLLDAFHATCGDSVPDSLKDRTNAEKRAETH